MARRWSRNKAMNTINYETLASIAKSQREFVPAGGLLS
jgi:hypothetical protein